VRHSPIIRLIAALAVVAGAACGGRDGGGDEASKPFRPVMAGDVAPAYATVMLAGDSVRVGGTAGLDSVTLLNVWATWCESCREEFADLERLHTTFAPRGLRVIAVSVDAGATETVRRFVESQKTTFAVAHDREGRIQQVYSSVGVPSTYLIARDGRVAWALTGNLHADPAAIRSAVERALAR
jgi:cytochrome c biogenesis protein CcmG, thiol:disulfide interchange protein DsbE